MKSYRKPITNTHTNKKPWLIINTKIDNDDDDDLSIDDDSLLLLPHFDDFEPNITHTKHVPSSSSHILHRSSHYSLHTESSYIKLFYDIKQLRSYEFIKDTNNSNNNIVRSLSPSNQRRRSSEGGNANVYTNAKVTTCITKSKRRTYLQSKCIILYHIHIFIITDIYYVLCISSNRSGK